MLQIQVVEINNLKQNKSQLKFRFLDFNGNFYSLKCAATSMNHSAFQWVEIAALFGGRGSQWTHFRYDKVIQLLTLTQF